MSGKTKFIWVFDGNVIRTSAELTLHGIFLGGGWHTWIDEQSVVGWLDAESY